MVIKIEKNKNNNFKFYDSSRVFGSESECDICGYSLIDPVYSKIIKTLKEEGYLDEDYPNLCCCCFQEMLAKETHLSNFVRMKHCWIRRKFYEKNGIMEESKKTKNAENLVG